MSFAASSGGGAAKCFFESDQPGDSEKTEIVEACSQALRTLNDTGSLEQKVERLQAEKDMVYGRIESQIHKNAQVAQDQEEYNRRIEALYARCEELKSS